MCRLLAIRQGEVGSIHGILSEFASRCEQSREYQGHGWGITYFDGDTWNAYKEINPIWEADFKSIPDIQIAVVHARSAYRDENIVIENNMPFNNKNYDFIFNGELQNVRIKETGRIGAEKLFNYILRFEKYGITNAIEKATNIINKKTKYIRAMNFIIMDRQSIDRLKFYIYSQFNETPEYFELMKYHDDNICIISSESLPSYTWETIANNSLEVI